MKMNTYKFPLIYFKEHIAILVKIHGKLNNKSLGPLNNLTNSNSNLEYSLISYYFVYCKTLIKILMIIIK